jgi:Ca2+-binding RTX toxin-like protein
MATFKFGNANNLSVDVTTDNDTYIIGNGAGDSVNAISSNGDTITLGNGDGDTVAAGSSDGDTITLGNGAGDIVDAHFSIGDTITLGNGNNDLVIGGAGSTITVGNGNDTINVGLNDTVTVGHGQDTFAFDQTVAGTIGAVTITGFDPGKDVMLFKQALATGFTATDNAQGNAVVTFTGDTQDTVTLLGVPSSALTASDFKFV